MTAFAKQYAMKMTRDTVAGKRAVRCGDVVNVSPDDRRVLLAYRAAVDVAEATVTPPAPAPAPAVQPAAAPDSPVNSTPSRRNSRR